MDIFVSVIDMAFGARYRRAVRFEAGAAGKASVRGGSRFDTGAATCRPPVGSLDYGQTEWREQEKEEGGNGRHHHHVFVYQDTPPYLSWSALITGER